MKKKTTDVNYHMSLSDRITIEQGLCDGKTFTLIAGELHRDPSTIAKEVKKAIGFAERKAYPVDCKYVKNCRRSDLCIGTDCTSFCKNCSAVDCTTVCRRCVPGRCEKLDKPPYVCNGCPNRIGCHLDKKVYRAKDAQRLYEKKLTDSRKGINLTREELQRLNELVSPLILQHQSLSHIYATHAEEIGICRTTLYKYIAEGYLDAKTMDLPRKIRYKKRKKAKVKQVHEYKSVGDSVSWVGVFSGDFVHAFEKQTKNKTGDTFRFVCTNERLQYLSAVLLHPERPDLLTLKSCLYALCADYCSQVKLNERTEKDDSPIRQIVDFVSANYQSHITLADLAKVLGYDYSYASRCFRRYFSQSFPDFVNGYRIEHALNLLTETDKSMTEVALESGFQSVRSFNDVFLKQLGRQPHTFRNPGFNAS